MDNVERFIDYCDNFQIITESYRDKNIESNSKNKCKIYSMYAGVGKNYAIEKLKEDGYSVYSIEKDLSFKDIYPNRSIDYPNDIIEKSKIYDVLFIPYFLGMDEECMKNKGIDYTIIYPNINLKREYIQRFKDMNFTPEQVKYLSDNYFNMNKDIKKSDCKKIELKKGEYCLDYIKNDLKHIN